MTALNKYKGNGRKKTKGELAAEASYSPRYIVSIGQSKTYYRKLGMLRAPRQRGMGITRAPSTKRLPKRIALLRIKHGNPRRL